jgi:outer membrane protein assembly factor BamB
VLGDTVYTASSGGVLAALDFLSGEPRWELHTQTALNEPPALAGDRLYFVAAGDPNLYAVDRSTGRMVWQMEPATAGRRAVVVNDVVSRAKTGRCWLLSDKVK